MTDGTGLIERFYEDVIGNCQMNLIDELVVGDIVDHEQGLPGQPPGREGSSSLSTRCVARGRSVMAR